MLQPRMASRLVAALAGLFVSACLQPAAGAETPEPRIETHPALARSPRHTTTAKGHQGDPVNVAFVGTKNYWRPKEISPTGQGFHWNSNAETYYLIGKSMGEAMLELLQTSK